MPFTLRFAIALLAGLAAAIVLAPVVAVAVASAGWQFPFPRIFDRTVMATLLLAMLWSARQLNFIALLRAGFASPRENIYRTLRGLAVSICAIAILFGLAIVVGGSGVGAIGKVAPRIPKYLLSAIAIAIIEEGFFRAFLLGGMKRDFGACGALILSSVIYSVAHLVRAPEKFYVTGYEPMAGLTTLAQSFDQFADPATAIPVVLGLFLLGLALGGAFLLTGTVYFSMGLHCGVVLGAKLWPKVIVGRATVPWWIGGVGPVPMIGGAAAWVVMIAIVLAVRPLTGRNYPDVGKEQKIAR